MESFYEISDGAKSDNITILLLCKYNTIFASIISSSCKYNTLYANIILSLWKYNIFQIYCKPFHVDWD